MAVKTINDSPTIADQILFTIDTPDDNGCLKINPYVVRNVTIHYIIRNYETFGTWDSVVNVPTIQMAAQYEQSKINLCAADSAGYQEALSAFQLAQTQLDSSQLPVDFTQNYFAEAQIVASYGTDLKPAWIATDLENAFITNIPVDAHGNSQYGVFELYWAPLGMREGDYFITWTYDLLPASSTSSMTQYFTLYGATQITTSIPTHQTVPGKYEVLLDRYRPEMFKMLMGNNDLAPYVLEEFDACIAKGFTFLEDMTNQILDVLDSNATPESFLTALGNTFGIRLRSSDPTLWRRQIKNAVPNFKQKGTLNGLTTALGQAGIHLRRFAKLWQVISKYTIQQCFNVINTNTFTLSNSTLWPIDAANVELYYRAVNSIIWIKMSPFSDYIQFNSPKEIEWTSLSFPLNAGDSIRLIYPVKAVPTVEQQILEDYIRTLPLADDRDERSITCPLKNWNVRLIAEDDPNFNNIVSEKFPYYDPLIFGWIRTEFPYSENIFNMEEYNGSNRESTNPCDIDCTFMDNCTYGQSSKFDVDVEIENLSHDRIQESQEIITEYVPFHALLNRMNIQGSIVDFLPPPTEQIQGFIDYRGEQITVCGPQINFHRNMMNVLQLDRTELANENLIDAGIATGYSTDVVLFAPNNDLDDMSIANNELEVLGPSPVSGVYSLERTIDANRAIVNVVPDVLLTLPTNFTFRISCKVFDFSPTNVYQDNVFKFSDKNVNFSKYSIQSIWDQDHPDPNLPRIQVGGSSPASHSLLSATPMIWQIQLGTNFYEIYQVLPDGSLLLNNGTPGLPNTNQVGVSYSLINPTVPMPIVTSTTGSLNVQHRGRVDVSGTTMNDVRGFISLDEKYYLRLANVNVSGTSPASHSLLSYSGSVNDCEIIGFVPEQPQQFYIDGYFAGDMVGVHSSLMRRNLDMATGNFGYLGMYLITPINYESTLGITNGNNPPPSGQTVGNMKENYLIKIGTDYYAMDEIDGNKITLAGPPIKWKQDGTANVAYEIYQYSFVGPITFPSTAYPTIPGHTLDYIDRHKGEIIDYQTSTTTPFVNPTLALSVKNAVDKNQVEDVIQQQESITYTIEYKETINE